MSLKPLINENVLLNAVACGDEKAFTELFYAYHHQLAEFVFSVTNSNELAEEIVHDVFLKIWKNRDGLSRVEKFTAYLFIITRNYTLNALRKLANDRKKSLQFEQYLVNEYNMATDEPEYNHTLLLENAVTCLPPRQQQVFLLKSQGFKNIEIASQMSISANSVKKYQQWSIQAISKYLKTKDVIKILAFFILTFF